MYARVRQIRLRVKNYITDWKTIDEPKVQIKKGLTLLANTDNALI